MREGQQLERAILNYLHDRDSMSFTGRAWVGVDTLAKHLRKPIEEVMSTLEGMAQRLIVDLWPRTGSQWVARHVHVWEIWPDGM